VVNVELSAIYVATNRACQSVLCLAGLLEVGDDIQSVLGFLEARKDHLVALDELFGILEPLHDVLVVPRHSGFLVRTTIRETFHRSGLVSIKAVQVGALFVDAALFDGVALRALGLEELGALLLVRSLRFLGHFAMYCT